MLRRITSPILSAVAVVSGFLIPQASYAVTPQPPAVTTVLPSDVTGVLLVDTTAEGWGRFNRFNPLPVPIAGPPGLPFISPQLNFAENVQPWIGKRAAVVFMPGKQSTTDPKASTLLLAAIEDAEEFDVFLMKVKASRAEQMGQERQYKGIDILEWPALEPPKPTPSQSPQGESTKLPTSKRLSGGGASGFGLKTSKPVLAAMPSSDGANSLPSPESSPQEATPPAVSTVYRPGLAIARLPGYVAMSATPAPLERLIDRWGDGTSLAEMPDFQRTLRHPQFTRSLAVGYVNFVQLADVDLSAASIPNPTGLPVPMQSIASLSNTLKSLAGQASTADSFIWIHPQGVQGEANLYAAIPQPDIAEILPPNPNQALLQVPASTYLALTSHQTSQQVALSLEGLEAAAAADPALKAGLDGMKKFFRELTGLDIEQDILPWMDGEYAFFMFPTKRGLFNVPTPTNFGLGAMVQTSDRSSAEAAFAKLDGFVQSMTKGEVKIVNRQVGGQSVVSWEAREPQTKRQVSIFARGWTNEDMLVMTSGVGPLEELLPKPYLSLDQAGNFRTATSTLPVANQGYFYVNVGSVLTLLSNTVFSGKQGTPDPFLGPIQQGLGRIRSFSATSSVTPEKFQFSGLMILAPNR